MAFSDWKHHFYTQYCISGLLAITSRHLSHHAIYCIEACSCKNCVHWIKKDCFAASASACMLECLGPSLQCARGKGSLIVINAQRTLQFLASWDIIAPFSSLFLFSNRTTQSNLSHLSHLEHRKSSDKPSGYNQPRIKCR